MQTIKYSRSSLLLWPWSGKRQSWRSCLLKRAPVLARSSPDPSHRCESLHSASRWVPPPEGTVYINVDAALFISTRRMGIGVVIRDHRGTRLATCSEHLTEWGHGTRTSWSLGSAPGNGPCSGWRFWSHYSGNRLSLGGITTPYGVTNSSLISLNAFVQQIDSWASNPPLNCLTKYDWAGPETPSL